MYTGETLAVSMREIPHHERQAGGHYASYAGPQRALADPPLPLEPRPSDSSQPISSGPQGPYRSPMSVQTDMRLTQAHSLPRLHDIVGPHHIRGPGMASFATSPPHGHASYGNPSWQPAPHTPQGPAMSSLQSRPGPNMDLPIHESPRSRQAQMSATLPPYTGGYSDDPRDSTAYRHDRLTHAPHTNGVNGQPFHGQYPRGGPDNSSHFRPIATTDHPIRFGGPPNVETSNKTFLRAEDVPGEGKYYVYEGGHRIPAQVDGEAVNPNWGLTKAMRPRKRLAQACLDCREKKIKCEPGQSNTCVQCGKAKRPCRRPPNQPPQTEGSSTATWGNNAGSPNSRGPSEHTFSKTHDTDVECHGRRRARDDLPTYEVPNKKHRSASPPFTRRDGLATRADSVNFHQSPRSPVRELRADTDPYSVESGKTIDLLKSFLVNVNDSTYVLYPHEYFVYWVKTSSDKRPDERLVLYAILALGSVFIHDSAASAARSGADVMGEALRSMGRKCAEIVSEALRNRNGSSSLPVAQTRLLLALYCHAQDDQLVAFEHLGMAANILSNLHLNTESGCSATDASEQYDFGFDNAQIAECRRRTMWAAFLMERFLGTPSYRIDVRDVLIRLPCDQSAYEQTRQQMSNAPFLHASCSSERPIVASDSPAASSVLVAAILGDVNNFISRGLHSQRPHYGEFYERQCEELWASLQRWRSQLPEHISSNPVNIENCIPQNYASHYLHMWAMYYWSVIKLHRYFRHEWLPQRRALHITRAYEAADDFLHMVANLSNAWDARMDRSLTQSVSPFVGTAIVAAVDVLAAAGLESGMRDTYNLTMNVTRWVQDLSETWKAAEVQHKECQHRHLQIKNIIDRPQRAASGCWINQEWGLDRRIEERYPLDYDGIYGVANPDKEYFEALRSMSRNNHRSNNHYINMNQHPTRGP